MRKVKITLKPQSLGKKLYLFPNAEALYVWLCALERGETITVPGIEELVLEPNCFIEAELRGFEYAYEDNQKFRRLELIRLGKAQQPQNASGLLVTIHTGWVSGGLLPMKSYADADIEVRVLAADEAQIDLAALFKDDVPLAGEQDDGSIDVNVDDESDAPYDEEDEADDDDE